MKLSERAGFLHFSELLRGDIRAISDGLPIFPYLCLSCGHVEFYTASDEETLRRMFPPTSSYIDPYKMNE
jgi:hypothetical protein